MRSGFRPYASQTGQHSLDGVTTVWRYRRPESLEQALSFLERHGAVIMGGGTRLNAGLVPMRAGAAVATELGTFLDELVPSEGEHSG